MMSSPASSNPAVNPDGSSTRRKKRKKMHKRTQNQSGVNLEGNPRVEWKSDAQQRIYSEKLLRALQHVRKVGGPPATGSRRVLEAANRALAATARGRSRWSRAVLTSRLKVKFAKKNSVEKRQRKVMTVITGGGETQRKSKVSVSRLSSKGFPAFQRKAGILGRVVPGCRKQPLPVVLEEAADYIAALEMQVRSMSALAELLSASVPCSSNNTSLHVAPADELNQQGPS